MRYRLDERDLGGSMAPRLNPKMVNTGLNARLGPRDYSPVRAVEDSPLPESGKTRRRSYTLLPPRFDGA